MLDLYRRRHSDKQITRHCGILSLMEPGSDIIADGGFEINAELSVGDTLIISPF